MFIVVDVMVGEESLTKATPARLIHFLLMCLQRAVGRHRTVIGLDKPNLGIHASCYSHLLKVILWLVLLRNIFDYININLIALKSLLSEYYIVTKGCFW